MEIFGIIFLKLARIKHFSFLELVVWVPRLVGFLSKYPLNM